MPDRLAGSRVMGEDIAIGVDVGGSKVLAGVVSEQGVLLDRLQLVTPHRSSEPGAIEDTVVHAVERLRASYGVAAVGVGAAGWVSADGETVVFAPHLSWRNEPLAARLRARLGLSVVLDNDANTTALAELSLGAAVGHKEVLCLTLGTGIGGAIVHGGRVERGANGLAGEFGHIQVVADGNRCECGNRGCWEQYASGNALVRQARGLVAARSPAAAGLRVLVADDPVRVTGPLVTDAARAGDPSAIVLFTQVGDWLGTGIAGLCAGLDPELVVIGGGLSGAGDLLLGPARDALAGKLPGRGFRPVPRIVAAELGSDAGMIGAALLVRDCRHRGSGQA